MAAELTYTASPPSLAATLSNVYTTCASCRVTPHDAYPHARCIPGCLPACNVPPPPLYPGLALIRGGPSKLLPSGRGTPDDAARYWNRFEADTYDCVLLDAPCTSERHVVQQSANDAGRGAKTRWSLQQCKDMAALQVKLLTAALKVSFRARGFELRSPA